MRVNATATSPSGACGAGTPPSPCRVRWWLLQESDRHSADRRAYLARLLRDCPTIQRTGDLAREFGRLLRQRDAAALDAWLVRAAGRGIAAFRNCVQGLRQDDAAAGAALREPYSNGPTEGDVTRIKLLKHQIYGRAKPNLLRQRVLYRANRARRGRRLAAVVAVRLMIAPARRASTQPVARSPDSGYRNDQHAPGTATR